MTNLSFCPCHFIIGVAIVKKKFEFLLNNLNFKNKGCKIIFPFMARNKFLKLKIFSIFFLSKLFYATIIFRHINID